MEILAKIESWSKLEILVKTVIFGEKSKIWSKINNPNLKNELLIKNQKFGQKSKIWPKIKNLAKNIF